MDLPSQFNLELQPVSNQQLPLLSNSEEESHGEKRSLLTLLFFLDVYPMMKQSQKVSLESDQIKELRFQKRSLKMHEQFSSYLQKDGKLIKQLLLFFMSPLLKVILILLVLTLGQLCMPLLIKTVIDFIKSENRDENDAIYLILAILFLRIMNIFSQAHSRRMMLCVGYDAMSVVSVEIMRKCLRVSLISTTEWSSGEITNLIQVDAQKLILITSYISSVLMIPLQLGISLYLMYSMIGLSFLIGCTIILIMILFNIFTGKQIVKSQRKLLKDKDERTKIANEIFSQIKFIKINALEEHFLSKVEEAREKEIKSIKNRLYYSAINIFSVWLTPQLILSMTFGLYVYLGHQLNPSTTFAIISLFQILQQPLLQLPIAINSLIEAKLSLKRISKFLATKDLMTNCIHTSEFRDPTAAVDFQNAVFYWNKQINNSVELKTNLEDQNEGIDNVKESFQAQQSEQPILKNINLRIEPGKFVSIIGDVGAGKTSFFQALLGEMIYLEGYGQPKIRLNGKLAYVSQKPWIQNASVKDNILFGKQFNQQQYDNAIYYSCLTQDLQILINGDQTMIGEKGINLSGGQKARISLARAIYSDSDIILLDDPLSAVDAHVGNFIMKECLLGKLKQTTRILITHALNYCKYTDYIYLFEKGEVIEQGTYRNMLKSQKFQEIKTKFNNNYNEDLEDSILISNPLDDLKKHSKSDSNSNLDSSTTITLPIKSTQQDEVDDLMILEERQKGNINYDVFLQYFAHNGGCLSFSLVMVIMIVWIFCYLGSSIWISKWAALSSKDEEFSRNTLYFSIYFTFGFMQAFFAFLRGITIIHQSIKSAQIIHNKMMKTLIYAPQCSFFERVPQGRIMNRLTKDINSLDTEIYWNISWLYTKVSQLISNTFLNVYASTYLIIFPIMGFFLICFKMNRLYMKASRELQRLELISKSPILSYFTETLSGLTTIRAYQQTNEFLYNFSRKIDTNKKIYYKQVESNAWFLQILGLSSLIVNISAIVYCIYYTQNPAFAGLLMTYASNIDVNILQTVESLSLLENGIISFERCLAYTNVKSEKRNEDNVRVQNWPSLGEIQFVNFSVQYRQNLPPALNNLNFKINSKEKIGVVGRTGAGKSSITLSLLRILESLEGQLLIDDVDISTLSLKQLRESITIILQDAVIFNATIKENLDPLGQRSNEEILSTINQCCLNRLISNRDGLMTKISEGGDNLSAGEKQLICIARAILKKTKIVIIDEATANIDVDTEHKIQQVIQSAFQNCTVLTIAHRINTILHCDKIIVIDKGQLKEYGFTQELLNDKKSTFYSIYQEALQNEAH
ncbi:unnamed protein product [Paramecium pentaurelia]|uniref:Uncharacterized protein n=1 Tax=Paramecium pentaurelia TaxID=43138 RepID=A0A8S1X5W0_9CILI|nr:unnamed protein product [Paramecium pentaurelia]